MSTKVERWIALVCILLLSYKCRCSHDLINKVVWSHFSSNVLSYGPDMMPNSFSSIVGIKFELLTELNQSMTFFTKCLTNSQSLIKCVINWIVFTAIETFVIRFDSVSKMLLFCYYNSMSRFQLKFFFSFRYKCFSARWNISFHWCLSIQVHGLVPFCWASLTPRPVNFDRRP